MLMNLKYSRLAVINAILMNLKHQWVCRYKRYADEFEIQAGFRHKRCADVVKAREALTEE
ncbi:hypothetical protein [Mixta intestinalis]|uniref:hypothetical protein n=1 Tax=Mixta intestinalis TaxID=1615494 RepID=UPI00136D17BF|nr:hypothetical protein [Mixta intestinalis]